MVSMQRISPRKYSRVDRSCRKQIKKLINWKFRSKQEKRLCWSQKRTMQKSRFNLKRLRKCFLNGKSNWKAKKNRLRVWKRLTPRRSTRCVLPRQTCSSNIMIYRSRYRRKINREHLRIKVKSSKKAKLWWPLWRRRMKQRPTRSLELKNYTKQRSRIWWKSKLNRMLK